MIEDTLTMKFKFKDKTSRHNLEKQLHSLCVDILDHPDNESYKERCRLYNKVIYRFLVGVAINLYELNNALDEIESLNEYDHLNTVPPLIDDDQLGY